MIVSLLGKARRKRDIFLVDLETVSQGGYRWELGFSF